MLRIVIYGLLMFCLFAAANAQCNNKIVEQAKNNLEDEYEIVYEFRVKLPAGNMKRPIPSSKYLIYLEEETNYRIHLVNASDYVGEAIAQIQKRGEILASTFNYDKQVDYQEMDFNCENSGIYQLVVSSKEGKKTCAGVIVSKMVNDSIIRFEKYIFARLGIKTQGRIAKKRLLKPNRKLDLMLPDTAYKEDYTIDSFSISKTGTKIGIRSKNNYFNHDQQRYIQELSSGDSLYIHHIRVRGPNGESDEIKPLQFIIK